MFSFMNSMSPKRPTTSSVEKDSVIVRPVESIAGSIVDEMRTLMFGRAFIPTTQNSSERTKSIQVVKKVSIDKTSKNAIVVDKKATSVGESTTISQLQKPTVSTPSKTPQRGCFTDKEKDEVSTPDKQSSSHSESSHSKKKRKSKGKHRRKSEDDSSSRHIEKTSKTAQSTKDDQSTLPNHILIPTFSRVMTKGLVLNLIQPKDRKQVEMTFWIDNSMLRWGKQKGGKEKGSAELKLLDAVSDIGPLEISLSFSSGALIELSVSSSVEKSLLLRSFLLAMETGIYQ